MSRHTVRTACRVCDGTGEVTDERDLRVICPGCMGLAYIHENAIASACDVVTHEAIEPLTQADGAA